MYRQQHFGLPVEIEAEWKQLLVAVEPSIERGINLGISRLKDAFQEYENSREEWFLLKKHKLEELLEAEKNKQLSDRLLQIINNSTAMDFSECSLIAEERLVSFAKEGMVQREPQLFIRHDSEFYRRRVYKIFKEAFMEVFVTRLEHCCRKLFGPFSKNMDKKLSNVLKAYSHQVEEHLRQVEEQLVQVEQAKRSQITQARNLYAPNTNDSVTIDLGGVVELFWKKWKPCWDNRETVFFSILDSGLAMVVLTALMKRLMLEIPSQGLVWNAQDAMLQDGRLDKLLDYFCQINPFMNRNLLEWLQDTVYLLCCLSDDNLYQISCTMKTLERHLLQCRNNAKWDNNNQTNTKVEHLLRLYSSLVKKSTNS